MSKHFGRFFTGLGLLLFVLLLCITVILTLEAIGLTGMLLMQFVSVDVAIAVAATIAVCYGIGYAREVWEESK